MVQDGDGLAIGEDAKIRIGDAGLQRSQFFFVIREHAWILDCQQAVVDSLGDRLLTDCVVHEAPCNIYFANNAASPWSDLRRQNRPDAELLTDGDEQGV